MFNRGSKVAGSVHKNYHQMDFHAVDIVGQEDHFHERPFLEAWEHSGNDYSTLPGVYKYRRQKTV